jgi:uncharacterized membrane protein YoaK (UPF0700 family)
MMSPASEDQPGAEVARANPPASAIVLSAVGGAVDGLGYVLLAQLFTAHITGNTVKTGTDLARLDVSTALVDGFPIAVFVLAGFAGALLRDLLARRLSRPRLPVLAASAALLLAFVAAGALLESGRAPAPGGASFYVLATLATASMGVQNAVKPSIAGRPVRTFMTGTMVDFGEALAAGAIAARARRREHLRRASVLLAVWIAYLSGAAVAGAAALRVGTFAAALPACAVLVALALEWRSR